MGDRSDWDDPKKRPPCTAVDNPFHELFEPEEPMPDELPVDEALFDAEVYEEGTDFDDHGHYDIYIAKHYYESSMENPRNRSVGFSIFPERTYPGQRVFTMVCDACGRLYFGIKGRFDCPHCGDIRSSDAKKMYFTQWGAWGGKKSE